MAALVPIEEYLHTSYRPDCDYVDGEVVERNVGLLNHSRALCHVLMALHQKYEASGVEVLPTLRLRVSPTRVRVPDVCAFLENPHEQVPTKPPFPCVEVLSPEDRWMDFRERVNDYFKMGVAHVWMIDPWDNTAFEITPNGDWHKVQDGILRTQNPIFEVPLSEIFE